MPDIQSVGEASPSALNMRLSSYLIVDYGIAVRGRPRRWRDLDALKILAAMLESQDQVACEAAIGQQ